MSSLTLLFLRTPAVSTRYKSLLKALYLTNNVSRVVPGISVTIFRSSPSRVLQNVDLPALGLPTKAILGMSSSSSKSPSGSKGTRSSNNSPVPLPVSDEIGYSISIPKL